MKDEVLKKIALFRYGIVINVINNLDNSEKSQSECFREASKKRYEDYRGNEVMVSAPTIKRWYYKFKSEGFDSLVPEKRSDAGYSRKIDDDIIAQIKYLKSEYPRIPATMIYEKLVSTGSISKNEVSLSTINRRVNEIKKEATCTTNKDMRRYEREFINEVWCGDSSVGPYIKIGDVKKKVYIIALIDDASRLVVAANLFLNDNFVNLMSVMKSAVTKFGIPRRLNFDNGSNYKNMQMTLLAARIETNLQYNPPRTPVGKAKIERWFRTLKDQWMSTLRMNEFKSLEQLIESFDKYVFEYNHRVHSSLNNLSPHDRFFNDSEKIRRLSDERIDKAFLLEIERRVSKDNVVVINEVEYEVPYKYSAQRITLRYSMDLTKVYVVKNNELEEIKLLNKIDNSKIKREKIKLVTEEN